MAGHGGFLKFKTRLGRCDMVIINSPLKGLKLLLLYIIVSLRSSMTRFSGYLHKYDDYVSK